MIHGVEISVNQGTKNEGIIGDLFEMNGFSLSSDSVQKFARFIEILDVWNKKINLTAHCKFGEIVLKDMIDSAYFNMYRIMYRCDGSKIMDLGCGAGFTGITVMIMSPELSVCFLDASRKKINFVRQVLSELGLKNGELQWGRGEKIEEPLRGRFGAVVSRASFNPSSFVRVASQYVQNSAHLFYMAGHEKKYPSVQSPEGVTQIDDVQYIIKPDGYKRRILIFKKDPS